MVGPFWAKKEEESGDKVVINSAGFVFNITHLWEESWPTSPRKHIFIGTTTECCFDKETSVSMVMNNQYQPLSMEEEEDELMEEADTSKAGSQEAALEDDPSNEASDDTSSNHSSSDTSNDPSP